MPKIVWDTAKCATSGVFETILEERNIIVDGGALDPIDDGAHSRYVIPAGTPLCPIAATGKYWPIRRTTVSAAVNNDTTITVADASPFKGDVGKGILFYTAVSATATLLTISSVDTSSNVIVVTAACTVASGAYVEAALNGAHGNVQTASPTQIPDAVILKEPIQVLADDGETTVDTPAVGVYRGAIRRSFINGPGTSGFDTLLKTQLPNISFLPVSPGTE